MIVQAMACVETNNVCVTKALQGKTVHSRSVLNVLMGDYVMTRRGNASVKKGGEGWTVDRNYVLMSVQGMAIVIRKQGNVFVKKGLGF